MVLRFFRRLNLNVRWVNTGTLLTYVYVLTVILLVNSHTKLAQDHYIRDLSLKRYLGRSLNSVQEETRTSTSEAPAVLALNPGEWKPNIADKNLGPAPLNGQADNKGPDKNLPLGPGAQPAPAGQPNQLDAKALEAERLKKEPQILNNNYPLRPIEIVPNLKAVEEVHVEPQEAVWQNVLEDGTLLVFSAVWEIFQGMPFIRALGMNGNTFMPKVLCRFTYENSEVMTIRGKIWMLPDHHEMTYKSIFFYCPLPDSKVPKLLSVIPQDNQVIRNSLPVIYNPEETRMFSVCLSPLFFNRSVEYELVQWIELNRLIGADMFYIYNYDSVPETMDVLNHYEKEGFVKVINWRAPDYVDVHYYGQVAMMNDCLFRNIRASRYMVNIDLDEFIVPRMGMMTWTEMLKVIPPSCEYSIRSSLVVSKIDRSWEGKELAEEYHLDTLLKLARREYVFDNNVRSKYIINTTCVDTTGIHFCWRYRNGFAETERRHVRPSVALTYHFRESPVQDEGKEIEERAVYKYHKELIQNVKNRWAKINEARKKTKSVNLW